MTDDLERTLDELGTPPGFAAYLRHGQDGLHVDPAFRFRVMAAVRGEMSLAVRLAPRRPSAALGVAAAVAVLLAAAFLPRFAPFRGPNAQTAVECGPAASAGAAHWVQAFAVAALAKDPARAGALERAVGELVASQTAEGGWANAETSARNVAALGAAVRAGAESARVAWRRGRRYLREHRIPELDSASFAQEARRVCDRLGNSALATSAAVCAEG